MSDYLKVEQREQVKALLSLGYSDRWIAWETGVHRETVGKILRELTSKPAKVFPGSEEILVDPERLRSLAARYVEEIQAKLKQQLTMDCRRTESAVAFIRWGFSARLGIAIGAADSAGLERLVRSIFALPCPPARSGSPAGR